MGRDIYLLRHAEPYFEKNERRCIGVTDLPLSEKGKAQAEKTGRWLREKHIGAVYSSPLRRCMQTARAAGDKKEIFTDSGLREMDTGRWENLTFREIRSRYPEQYAARGENIGYYAPPGGESFCQAGMRFGKALDRIRRRSEENLLIVSHAGVIRGYLCMLLGRDMNQVMDLPQPYAGVSILREEGRILHVEKIGYRPKEFMGTEEILSLYQKCGTPEKVIRHMQAAADMVKALLDRLDPENTGYDRRLLVNAALVHDIARTQKNHAEAGADILRAEGFEEASVLVRAHHSPVCSKSEKLSMEEILFYADKRVMEDRTVSVEERFRESRKKCNSQEALEKHRRLYEKTIYIERKIKRQEEELKNVPADMVK